MMTGMLILHLLAAVIWVGGMFFAHMALRPVAGSVLQPPLRLTLWAGVFGRFFPWVWLAVAVLLVSGFGVIHLQGGMKMAPWNIHLMMALGFVMILIYCFIYLVLFRRLKHAVSEEDWARGGAVLARIRVLVTINLILGLTNVVVAKLGAVIG